MMRRILAAASAFLIAAVGLSLTTANAASFTLNAGPGFYFEEVGACAPGVVNGSPIIQTTAAGPGTGGSYAQVAVSEIPADCHHLPLEVFAYDASGALLAGGGDATTESGSATVTVDPYTGISVDAVFVRIDGWVFPTTWTTPVPSNPTPPMGPITCYQLDAHGNLVTDASGQGVKCASEPRLTGVSTWQGWMQVAYEIDAYNEVLLVLDFADATYDGYDGDPATSHVHFQGYYGGLRLYDGCSELPVVEVVAGYPGDGSGIVTLQGAVYLTSAPQGQTVCSP